MNPTKLLIAQRLAEHAREGRAIGVAVLVARAILAEWSRA